MSARPRLVQRRPRPSNVSANGGRSPSPPLEVELPPYESLALPLDDDAVRAMMELANNRMAMHTYDTHLKKSVEMLRDAVGRVNDLYTERKGELQRLADRRREKGSDQPTKTEEEIAKSVDKLSTNVPEATEQIERCMRLTIDMQVQLEDEYEALTRTTQLVQDEQRNVRDRLNMRELKHIQREERIAAAIQRRAAASVKGELDNEDDQLLEEEDEEEEMEPAPSSVLDFLQKARETSAAKYAEMDAYRRYGLNNDYITFKQTWHDAVFPDGEAALPDASAWFGADGQPVILGPDGAVGGGGDDDDDLIVAREIISFKCPLTLRTMVDPYKSRLCGHTFEKQGIIEYLQQWGAPKKCPQTGCDTTLTPDDMVPDNVMRRRIERAEQIAQRDGSAPSDDDAEEVEAGDDNDKDDGKGSEISEETVDNERVRQVKRERYSRSQVGAV